VLSDLLRVCHIIEHNWILVTVIGIFCVVVVTTICGVTGSNILKRQKLMQKRCSEAEKRISS